MINDNLIADGWVKIGNYILRKNEGNFSYEIFERQNDTCYLSVMLNISKLNLPSNIYIDADETGTIGYGMDIDSISDIDTNIEYAKSKLVDALKTIINAIEFSMF